MHFKFIIFFVWISEISETHAYEGEYTNDDDDDDGADDGDLPGLERARPTVPRAHATVLPLLHLTPPVSTHYKHM